MDSKNKKRILFVDDDVVAVEVVTKYLEQWYEIETAGNGEEAVKACQKSPPDLVMMDLMMPGSASYEGDEAIRLLTTDPKTASIPIIIQTGFQNNRVLVLMSQVPNIVGILVKPFDLAMLKRKIEVILGKPD